MRNTLDVRICAGGGRPSKKSPPIISQRSAMASASIRGRTPSTANGYSKRMPFIVGLAEKYGCEQLTIAATEKREEKKLNTLVFLVKRGCYEKPERNVSQELSTARWMFTLASGVSTSALDINSCLISIS